MRLKKSYCLLFVLLLLPLVLVGVVQSVSSPSIYINASSYGINVIGNGWTAYADVTVYYDVEDAAHMVAVVKANYAGNFQTYIPTNYVAAVGTHTVIAVQGADKATAVYDVGAASPPDDRLLNPILDIKDKLDDVDTEVKAIEAKLDPGGSFYNFVNNWFGTIDGKVDTVDGKVDTVQDKVDDVKSELITILRFNSGTYNTGGVLGSDEIVFSYNTNKPVLFTVSLMLQQGNIAGNHVVLWSPPTGHIDWAGPGEATRMETITFGGYQMWLTAKAGSDLTNFHWKVIIQGTPGTIITGP